MNFEPQKFFIGLVDFFSILMPGAMLAYLLKDWAAARFGMAQGFPLVGTEAGTVFVFASYLLGHFVFLMSSTLDDWVYDPLRAWTDWGQIKHLAKGKGLSAPWKRSLASSDFLFGKNADAAVMQAQWIKARALSGLEAEDAINAFQWSKAWLAQDFAGGLLAVQRFEADSKFFRSFVVVLGLLALFYFFHHQWLAMALCFAGLLPALWRFIDQRFKATQQAYWFLLTLEAEKTEPSARPPRRDGLTHAGAVVYRGKGSDREILLVQASHDRSEWVLPKGHIEPGEDSRVTAIREVREETGHWAKYVHYLDDKPLGHGPNAPKVRWFLLERVEEPKEWPEENRQFKWLPLDKAIATTQFQETKNLLENLREYFKDPKAVQDKHEVPLI